MSDPSTLLVPMGVALSHIAKATIQNPTDKPFPGSGRLTYTQKAFLGFQKEAKSIIAYLKATPLFEKGKPKTSARDTINGKFEAMQEYFANYYKPFETNNKTNLVKSLKGQVKDASTYWQKLYKTMS